MTTRKTTAPAPVLPEVALSPADRFAVEAGCWFDPATAARPVEFIERFCRQSQGRWSGQALTLLPWQRDFLRALFGWKREDGTRRFRSAYVEVAKKNGKSTMVSALVLYLILADGEPSPRIFLNACDKEQASLIFDEAGAMVKSSPDLARRLEVIDYRKRIVTRDHRGRIQANSSEAPAKDGPNASAVIFDELHRQRDRELWDTLEHAGIARVQPLRLSLTTAGDEETGLWFEQRDYSERVISGELPDWGHLGAVYRAQPDADLENPAVWRAANPSLGAIIPESDFAADLRKAKDNELSWNLFKRLRLNIVAKSAARYISPDAWNQCAGPRRQADDFIGRPLFLGADLSRSIDLTALVGVWPGPDGATDLVAWFWIPENRIDELTRADRVPYRAWIAAGYVFATPGSVIDYGFIRTQIKALAARHDLRAVMIDPYNATQFCTQLAEQDGLPVQQVRQGYLSLSAPTKELERLVVSGSLRHGGNPILKWMAANAVAVRDPSGNVKLDKAGSREKIDGLAALVNALAGVLVEPAAGPSVYETRGLLAI